MKRKTAALLISALMIPVQWLPTLGTVTPVLAAETNFVPQGESVYITGMDVCLENENGSLTLLTYLVPEVKVQKNGIIEIDIPEYERYEYSRIEVEGPLKLEYKNGKLTGTVTMDIEGLYYSDYSESYQCHNQAQIIFKCKSGLKNGTGWVQIPLLAEESSYNPWYYFNDDGNCMIGLQTIGKNKYYFFEGSYDYPQGAMACSQFVEIDGKRYFFGSSGAMKYGWIRTTSNLIGMEMVNWNYADPETGVVIDHGWLKDKGRWYYFDNVGQWGNSIMVSSMWIEDNGNKYYLTNSGAMATSRWILSPYDQQYYYVDASGKMLTNTWIGNYHVNENGVWDKTK